MATSSNKVRVGVIGAGAIASHVHIPAFQSIPGVEVVAVADPKEGRAAEVARQHGIAHAFQDYRDLLAIGGLDVVSVCSPNAFHAEHSIAALEAGAHVLCEKPMALSTAEAMAMVEAAQRTGKLLMVGMTNRFRPELQALRRYVADGLLGELYYIKAGWLRRSGIPGYGSWFTTKRLAGGGCLLDIGVHFLDLALWIAGFPKPLSVCGVTFSKFGPRGKALGGWGADIHRGGTQVFDVEDLASAFIRLEGGAALVLEVSWASYVADGGEQYLRFLGTEGGAEMSSRFEPERPIRFYSERADVQFDAVLHTETVKMPHKLEIDHFLACVRGEAEPAILLNQSVMVTQVLEAIYRSAESGQLVSIG